MQAKEFTKAEDGTFTFKAQASQEEVEIMLSFALSMMAEPLMEFPEDEFEEWGEQLSLFPVDDGEVH